MLSLCVLFDVLSVMLSVKKWSQERGECENFEHNSVSITVILKLLKNPFDPTRTVGEWAGEQKNAQKIYDV